MELVDLLIAELKERYGKELNLDTKDHYLFFQDGVFKLNFDEDEKTIKVDIFLSNDVQVSRSDKKITDLMKEVI